MTSDKKDNSEIYSLRDPATLTEKVIMPPSHSEIFAIKSPDPARLGSVIGIALSNGVFLCNAYRLDKCLSRAEAGEIWQASDLQASRNVVVYLPPQKMRTDATAMEPVWQAARHVEALEHPRIVPFLDSFTDPEHGFFSVRKFVNGKTLDVYRKEYIKRHKKFAVAKAIKMLSDIAHALDYVHSAGVIHGDLCPTNILVGLDDEVYVANFALLPVHATKAAGQNYYCASDIATGQATTVLSEVYALATLAYELLSGRLPFLPETLEDVPLPVPGVPSTMDAVIRKALARDPEDRYSSCGAFVQALEASFHESMKIKSVAMPSSQQRKSITSRPLFWATLLALLFVGVGIVWVHQPSDAPLLPEQVAQKQPVEEVPTPAPQQRAEQSPVSVGEVPAGEIADGGEQTAADQGGNLGDRDATAFGIDLAGESTPDISPEEQGETIGETVPSETASEAASETDVSPPLVAQTVATPLAAPDHLPSDPTEQADEPLDKSESVETNEREQNKQEQSEPVSSEIPEASTENVSLESLPQGNRESPSASETVPSGAVPSVSTDAFSAESIRREAISVVSDSTDDRWREEGELTTVTIDGVLYRFRWCKGRPFPMETDGFWMQETPVTQELWKAIMGAENLREQPSSGNRLSVVRVSWRECERFVEKLNDTLAGGEFKGFHFSLPTEFQWEQGEQAKTHDVKIVEWCQDWFDEAKNSRVVRGSGVARSGRDPQRWQGFDNVGFRLVIVRGQ